MGEVGIHRDDRLVALVERGGEPVAIRRAEPRLPARSSTLMRPSSAATPSASVAGAIGAVVVDDQHIGLGRCGANGAQEADDVLRLVVGR